MAIKNLQGISDTLSLPEEILQAQPSHSYLLSHKSISTKKIISGIHKRLIFFLIHANLLWIAIRWYRNPALVVKAWQALSQLRRDFLGEMKITRMAKIDGTYYWDLYTPGWRWNSRLFNDYIAAELNRLVPIQKKANRFLNVFLSITKKCPLKCEHCFEWDTLNGKEKLSQADLKNIVRKFQEKGLSQIQFTGGEPMLRINDLVEVLRSSKSKTDFWLLTSGFNFTQANAERLKSAGLTGVVISLDHFDEDHHNKFRGHKESFKMVQEAVKNALASNLVTALSICVTKSFVTQDNLMKYAELARQMGVSFIQILEPKAVGHYKGLDVTLNKEHEKILSDFFVKMNSDERFSTYPIVCYHGYYQRRLGCLAAGNRSLYIDAEGDLHSCPFSPAKKGSVLVEDIDPALLRLRETGCNSFKVFSN